jgi:hypothetical protein
MKKIFSILLLIVIISSMAIFAVGCNDDETLYEATLTKEKAEDLLFGQNKAFALMDKSVNFSVAFKSSSYKGSPDESILASEAKLVLDETAGENFVSIYVNSTEFAEGKRLNATAYMFLEWEEKRGELEKTLVDVHSISVDYVKQDISWQEYTGSKIDSDVKLQHQALIANSGANIGVRYIREVIYNQNDDIYDTIQVTGKDFFSDKEMTQLVKTEIVITYSYVDEDGASKDGVATVVLENKNVKLIDGTTVEALAITSINIKTGDTFDLSAAYTYGVESIDAPTEDNFITTWPSEYPIG